MTTENSGEAVCVAIDYRGQRCRRLASASIHRPPSENPPSGPPNPPWHPFRPAPENSEGSVPAVSESAVSDVAAALAQRAAGVPFTPRSALTPASTDRIQEARENIGRCDYCKGSGGFSDTTMGRGGFGGQMLTMCPRCKGVGFDLTEFEAAVRESVEEEQRESWYLPLKCPCCGRLRLLVSGHKIECEKCGADNETLRLFDEEQREKYQELVEAADRVHTAYLILPKSTPDEMTRLDVAIERMAAALSSTEIKGETAG